MHRRVEIERAEVERMDGLSQWTQTVQLFLESVLDVRVG